MKPPIKVSVSTDNKNHCELRFAGADGVAVAVPVPASGNTYSGLHAAREGIERIMNDVLAAHGVIPDAPPESEEPAPEGVTPES